MTDGDDGSAYLANVGFFITYKCQVACSHCSVQAGPHRTEEMREQDAADWIGQAASYRNGMVKAVNFTGGEPFYDLERFRGFLRLARSAGLLATAVTNAYWATTVDAAIQTLQSLPELQFVQFSADEHHQQKIPFDRVLNAIAAAKEIDIVYNVAVCTESETSDSYKRTVDRLAEVTDREHIKTVFTFLAGRAGQTLDAGRLVRTDVLPSGSCGSADTPVIFPDGRVLACIGPAIDIPSEHALLLGNLREQSLAQILDRAEVNTLLHLIRVWGPARLFESLEARVGRGCLPRGLVKDSLCDLCCRLMSDSKLRRAAVELAADPEFVEKTAYGRLYHLHEDGMARSLGLLAHTTEPAEEASE